MAGLLDALSRTCPRGHGALELLTGLFALTGVHQVPPAGGLLGSVVPRIVQPNGQMLPLRVWRCPACGHVELVSEP